MSSLQWALLSYTRYNRPGFYIRCSYFLWSCNCLTSGIQAHSQTISLQGGWSISERQLLPKTSSRHIVPSTRSCKCGTTPVLSPQAGDSLPRLVGRWADGAFWQRFRTSELKSSGCVQVGFADSLSTPQGHPVVGDCYIQVVGSWVWWFHIQNSVHLMPTHEL